MTETLVPPQVRGRRALVVSAAALAPLAVWLLAVPLAGVHLSVDSGTGTRPVGPVSVLGTALLAALAGWALLALLERRSRRPRRTWTLIAVVVAVLSLAGPLGSGSTPAAQLTLAAMHVVVAAVLISALPAGVSRAARAR